MTPQQFIAKWGPGGPAYELNEEQGAQSHFMELCDLLGVPRPGSEPGYLFEQGGRIAGQASGYADVYKRGAFAWENKAPGKNLDTALRQLLGYTLALENPPLLVVCDRLTVRIHTQFNGHPSERHEITLADLEQHDKRELLKRVWTAPESFRPRTTNRDITEEAARSFATLAERLRQRGNTPDAVAHFLTQCLFCCFAEDVGLLPGKLFDRLINAKTMAPERLGLNLGNLFGAMKDGGLFGVDDVPWFNGGLFARVEVPPLAADDVAALRAASTLDWSAIDATIFGTLFERGLDPAKRSQLGANFTDPVTIMRLVEPVVQRPLLAEWACVKPRIEAALGKSRKHGDKAWREAQDAFAGFLERLRNYRVLDPACGSGNFLYLALKCLKDIEHQVNLEAEALGLQRQHDMTGPHNVLGIELNEYAAELARVTVWIGELQWRIQRGYPFKLNPVLEPLDQIETRDAVLGPDGKEAAWPVAEAVVGNPPFLGTKRQWGELGVEYSERLRSAYTGRVPGFADLVCYWFERARTELETGRLQRAGLVATNSIRGGANRDVLDRVARSTRIYEAWSDIEWVNDGAAVRVSLIAFGESLQPATLDGHEVAEINPDLSAGVDLTVATKLAQNVTAAFVATVKAGPFDISGKTARDWLALPNPHGESNAEVVKRWANGMDMTRRWSDTWIVDFGVDMPQSRAALFERPFAHVEAHVKPARDLTRADRERKNWWLLARPIPAMRLALANLQRFVATPVLAKHRLFVWMDRSVLPDHQLVVIARADDTTFGILHSRLHELWSLRLGTSLEDRPRYTPTTCFETFPFPAGLTPADTAHQKTESVAGAEPSPQPSPARGRGSVGPLIPAGLPSAVRPHAEAIARAAQRLVALRDAWLNPPEWSEPVPEVVPLGMDSSPYPDRIVAKPGFEKELAKRTLTNLYNQRPAWLAQAHAALDAAVAAAYGWTDWTPAMPDDEILRRLLALNRERAGK